MNQLQINILGAMIKVWWAYPTTEYSYGSFASLNDWVASMDFILMTDHWIPSLKNGSHFTDSLSYESSRIILYNLCMVIESLEVVHMSWQHTCHNKQNFEMITLLKIV